LNYTPHTPEDIERALEAVGVDSIDELFASIPAGLLDPAIDLGPGLDETALLQHLRELAAKNQPASTFLGGGARKHFMPSVTSHLAMQSEFVTAYTPYQPEVAQGLLQATFEFQTMISELTGLPVANASMYDGASSAAEAALLAVRQTGRNKVVTSRGVHPETRQVLHTYLNALDIEIVTLDLTDLTTPVAQLGDDVAALLVQQPNYLGYLERMPELAASAHEAGALLIASVDLLTLGILQPPGEYGADIAVGDGQTSGNPLALGGPSFGFMVVTEKLIRQLPGRIVGQTTDVDGRRAFVLTLQAREQHIRRSKAKSNICSNHQLTAIMAAINLAALGPAGLREAGTGSVLAAHDLAGRLRARGFDVPATAAFFNEFVVRTDTDPLTLRRQLADRGLQAGIPVPAEYGLGNALLLAATELTTGQELAALTEALTEIDSMVAA
jgi:glycine dehydrogenase subunit 1